MPKPPKDITCKCGHTTTLETSKLLCIKCGKYVFYNDQEKRRYRMATFYTLALFLLAFGFLTFLFVEMIVTPLMSGQAVIPK